MNSEKLQAWWSARQGFDGSLSGQPAEAVLARAGWARSVGGVSPYLTLFARAGLRRAEVDEALANVQIHELPAARGCTYVVPQPQYALALNVGQQFSAEAEMKTARRFGVTDKEITKLRDAIIRALAGSPLDTDQIRKAVGTAARNLGPDAAKKGITTTLPVALGLMQSAGEIRRIPINGRLDQQRYKYATWNQSAIVAEPFTELARRYFSWIGPAQLSEFQWFSGLGVKATKEAVAPLALEDLGDGYLIAPADRAAFEQFKAPNKPRYALLGSIDSIVALRGAGMAEVKDHGIFDRGRLIGVWQFDPEQGEIVWNCTVKPDAALRDAVKRTEAFIREDLGDARSFSLDSPKSRAPRIAELRKAGIP